MKYILTMLLLLGITFATAKTGQYWHASRLDDGRVRVVCDNGADATIEPTDQFGSIVVSCGTR